MYSSLEQMADHFDEILDAEFPVDEIVMHSDDFPAFYEQNSEHIELSGAPWVSGEMVGWMWAARIRLSNGVNRRMVRLSSERSNIERELLL